MKILVTGGNGYLGTGGVKQRCDDGVEVIGTNFKTNLIYNRANIVSFLRRQNVSRFNLVPLK